MDLNDTVALVKGLIAELIQYEKNGIEITEDSALVGGESFIDSMKLVELCVNLEDKADEMGFEFDWTSDAAMSRSQSMFRSVRSLSEEFYNQALGNV